MNRLDVKFLLGALFFALLCVLGGCAAREAANQPNKTEFTVSHSENLDEERTENGKNDAPFLIDDATDLWQIGKLPGWGFDKQYKLTADIEVDDWIPIAHGETIGVDEGGQPIVASFSGIFDGNGHQITIRSLNPDYLAEEYETGVLQMPDVGLFGWTYGGRIKNLLVHMQVRWGIVNSSVGAVVGTAGPNTMIENCAAICDMVITADITADSFLYIGGITGNNNGFVKNCYTVGRIQYQETGNGAAIGGVAGHNMGQIDSCYSTCTLSGSGGDVGGIVGVNNTYAETLNCVGLNPETTVRGICGWNSDVEKEHADTEYARDYAGMKGTLSNNIFVARTGSVEKEEAPVDGGRPISVFQATVKDTYEGLAWAFGDSDDAPWQWGGEGYPLPILYWQEQEAAGTFPQYLLDS